MVARAGLSSNYTGNRQCGSPASDQLVTNGVVQFRCDPPLRASYVHLYKDSTNPNTTDEYLEIAEITVEEYRVSSTECVMVHQGKYSNPMAKLKWLCLQPNHHSLIDTGHYW